MKSHCFRLHRSYSISFILSNVGEIFWDWIQKVRTYFTYSIKQAGEIEKFHVAVVQQRLRNVQKGVMHVLKLLLFCCSRCRRRRRWLDFKKSGYHGNVTSHFPSLLSFPNWAGPGLRLGATVKNPARGQYGAQSSVASTFMRVPRAAEHSLWWNNAKLSVL